MFLIGLGIFIVLAIIFSIVSNYFKYWGNYQGFKEQAIGWHEKTVKLTFDEVMKYSAIKPDKWYVSGNLISYKIDKKNIIGESKFYVYFSSYKEYRKFIQWWENKKTKAMQEAELLKGLEFCDLMKKDCQALKEESQEAIRKAAINSAKLIKQTVENDTDLRLIYKCVVNEDGTIELVKCDCTKTAQLSKQPEDSISCSKI